MAYTARHGRNAAIYIDCSSAGTFAGGTTSAGTTGLTQVFAKNTWSIDMSADFVDTTSFGDSSKTSVSGLPSASGDINGNWDAAGAGTVIKNIIGASTERAIMIFPDATNNASNIISGKAFFSVKGGGGVTSAVSLDIHFEAGPSGITWTMA